METILAREFEQICHNDNTKIIKYGRSLEQPKVYETSGNIIIKLFYPKRRLLSSDKFKPYALRFCKNSDKLRALGYVVPRIIQVKYCSENKIYLVFYEKLSGIDLRSFIKQQGEAIIDEVAKLVADLHQRGVFFRCIHLENLLRLDNGKIGLLDIVDMRFKNQALSLHMRYRNIMHLFADENDRAFWQQYGITKFLATYFRYAGLGNVAQRLLSYFINRRKKI